MQGGGSSSSASAITWDALPTAILEEILLALLTVLDPSESAALVACMGVSRTWRTAGLRLWLGRDARGAFSGGACGVVCEIPQRFGRPLPSLVSSAAAARASPRFGGHAAELTLSAAIDLLCLGEAGADGGLPIDAATTVRINPCVFLHPLQLSSPAPAGLTVRCYIRRTRLPPGCLPLREHAYALFLGAGDGRLFGGGKFLLSARRAPWLGAAGSSCNYLISTRRILSGAAASPDPPPPGAPPVVDREVPGARRRAELPSAAALGAMCHPSDPELRAVLRANWLGTRFQILVPPGGAPRVRSQSARPPAEAGGLVSWLAGLAGAVGRGGETRPHAMGSLDRDGEEQQGSDDDDRGSGRLAGRPLSDDDDERGGDSDWRAPKAAGWSPRLIPAGEITYAYNLFGLNGPRRIQFRGPLPADLQRRQCGILAAGSAGAGKGHEAEAAPVRLRSKWPRWHPALQCWCLDFGVSSGNPVCRCMPVEKTFGTH